MIKVLNEKEIDDTAWRNLLKNSGKATFFQSPECYQFYKKLTFLQPFLYGVSKQGVLTGLVCGYLIAEGSVLKRFFSKRAIIPGGILIADDCLNDSLEALLSTLSEELKHRAIYTELRNYHDYSNQKETFILHGFDYHPHLNFHVSTESVNVALSRLSSTKRRDVKLSLKNGAVIENANNQDDVDSFYKILSDLYRLKIKTPLFPKEFFDQLSACKEARLFLIKYQNEVIGGSFCVSLGNEILYEWFVCGQDGRFKNIFPSTLATWAAIEYASENGYRLFDMMGAGKPDEGYGVRDFKAKFGGQLVEHGRFVRINQPLLYSIGKKAVAYLKKKK